MKNLFRRRLPSQEGQKAAERLAKNAAANEAVAKKEFPNEIWLEADKLKLDHVSMPKDVH
jgi:hypothetical protein